VIGACPHARALSHYTALLNEIEEMKAEDRDEAYALFLKRNDFDGPGHYEFTADALRESFDAGSVFGATR
jgi:hypothetical protein